MHEAGKPVSAGDVTKALGAIVSPVRCKWEPAK